MLNVVLITSNSDYGLRVLTAGKLTEGKAEKNKQFIRKSIKYHVLLIAIRLHKINSLIITFIIGLYTP